VAIANGRGRGDALWAWPQPRVRTPSVKNLGKIRLLTAHLLIDQLM
jgi:hypothetical protein